MKTRAFGTAVTLIAVVAAGCATTKASMKPDEAIAARQQLMKDQGAAMRVISDKMKAGQAQTIGPEAEKLVSTAKRIPELFPQGSLNAQTSRAKPEIWQKRQEFEANAKSLETQAARLAQTSKTASAADTQAAVNDLGRTTCTACHDTFRGPEIKK